MTKSAENKHKTRIDEGGYYAIKGFLYQFDKTLIEVITNPQTSVAFENRQDIDYEDYVLLELINKGESSFVELKWYSAYSI